MFLPKDLEQAIESHDIEKIRRLVRLINWTDCTDGFLPSSHYLMIAAETGKAEFVQLLIESGADVNQSDEDGWTVLMYATLEGYFDIVKVLVKAGADVNIQSPEGEYALYIAAYSGHEEIFDYLAPLTNPELTQEAEQHLLKEI